MSFIWSPKNPPPDPNTILPWSEDAENIWQQIIKKRKVKQKKERTLDPRNYYNEIYRDAFGSSLNKQDHYINRGKSDDERSPSDNLSAPFLSQKTSSGYVNKIVPLTDPTTDFSIFGQGSTQGAMYEKVWQHSENCLDDSIIEVSDEMNIFKEPVDNTKDDQTYPSTSKHSIFHSARNTETKDNNDRIDNSQSLFSQLDTQSYPPDNAGNNPGSGGRSDMSSPPLDVSPDNESYLILSQRYGCKKQKVHHGMDSDVTGDDSSKHKSDPFYTEINESAEIVYLKSNSKITETDKSFLDSNCNENNLVEAKEFPKSLNQQFREYETKLLGAGHEVLASNMLQETSGPTKGNKVTKEASNNNKEIAVTDNNSVNTGLFGIAKQINCQQSNDTTPKMPQRKLHPKGAFTVPLKKSNSTADSNLAKSSGSVDSNQQPKIDTMLQVVPQNNSVCQKDRCVKNKRYKLCYLNKMTEEEKDTLKNCLQKAEEVAMTLCYKDGSSQIREYVGRNKKARAMEEDCHPSGIAMAYPVNLGISQKLKFVCFPLSGKDIDKSNYTFCRDVLNELLSSKCRKLCFEAQETVGIIFSYFHCKESEVCTKWNVLDPKVAGWLLNPDHPPVTFKHVLMPYADLKQEDGLEVEDEICSDLSLLGPAMLHIYQRLKQQNLWQIFTKLEMPLLPLLAVMETRGIKVNTDEMLEMSDFLKKKLGRLERSAHEAAGQSFNMNSHPQLRLILFEKLQLDLNLPMKKIGTTTQGNKSTSEAVLSQLADMHPLPKLILEYRQLQKLKSTYVDGMMVFVKDSELYTHWDQIAAATGRLTSTNPNIQAIPKQAIEVTDDNDKYVIGKEPKVIQLLARSPFTSHEGWTLLAADFKQIELRILAHLSGDEKLLKVFQDETYQDIFVELASQWLDKPSSDVNQQDREQTKRVVYSVMYGAGKDKLAEYLKISAENAKAIIQSFLLKFPGISKFNKSCIETTRKERYQSTILKRRRYFPNITHVKQQLRAQAERRAVNFCVQGSAADLCKAAMIQVEHCLQNCASLNGHILFQIHDELLLEIPDNQLKQTAELLRSVMESSERLCGNISTLKVPLRVSLSAGKSWGHLKSIDKDEC